MYGTVWTEATREAIDGVTVDRAGDSVILSATTSGPGPERAAQYAEASRHLTTTAARVLAAQLTEAADLIDHGPDPRETLRELRAILWPPEDVDAQWSADTLDGIAETLTRVGMGRPA